MERGVSTGEHQATRALSCSTTRPEAWTEGLFNYCLSQKFKKIGINEFPHVWGSNSILVGEAQHMKYLIKM
jgi:hypothetical protein